MMKKLFERSPLKQAVVQYCRIFDPKGIASYSEEATKKALKSLLFQLLDRKLITAKYSDNVKKEFEEFIDNEVVLHKDKFLSFDKASQRLDVFYFQSSISITKYASFVFMLKFVCILSHGQASVERSFSFRNVILEENLTAESLNAQRIVLDHMISNDLKPESTTITAKLIVAVKASRLKYEQAKIEKAEKKLKGSKNEQLKIITKETNEQKTKVDS